MRSKDMQKAIDYISEVSKRLNKVVIENLDFQLQLTIKKIPFSILTHHILEQKDTIQHSLQKKIIYDLEKLLEKPRANSYFHIMIVKK